MRRSMWTLWVIVLVVGAFFLGRWSRVPQQGVMAGRHDLAAVSTNADDTTRDAFASPGAAVANLQPGALSPQPRAPGPASSARELPDLPVSPKATGPRPLTPDDEKALARAERVMSADSDTTRDLLDRAQDETPDAHARQLEALIAQSILQHGGRFTQLRLSPPLCTQLVCIVRGISAGDGQDPRSDWQTLSGAVMNEPWFREAFDDMRGFVGGDGRNTVYITLYVRCVPGTCRFGRK